MSYTQTQLAALKAALARGVRTVTTDGNTITYASTDEMLKVISIMEREIAAQTTPRQTYVNPVYSRGT